MRKILLGILVLIVIVWTITYFFMPSSRSQTLPLISIPTKIPTLTQAPPMTIEYEGKTYAVSSFSETDASKITIIGNYEQKLTSGSIIKTHACTSAINGGFYDTAHLPIGLFIENGETRSAWAKNALFNGVFYVGRENQLGIGRGLPKADIAYALQSGPILVEQGTPLALRIKDDEYARRSVVFSDALGVVYFLSTYNPESVYEGPLLADLPDIVSLYGKNTGIVLDTAMNLDGGSASFFLTSDTTLSELMTVGSVICIR